jgi:hypothetical protein
METKRIRFREPSIRYLKEFILDKHVFDTDSISLNEEMFDELVLEFRLEYGEPMPHPFIFLGVWVKPDKSIIRYNEAIITKDEGHHEMEPIQAETLLNGRVYQCGYCTNIVDEFGNILTDEALHFAKEKCKTFPISVCKYCERSGNKG